MVDTGVDRSHPAFSDATFGGFLDLVNPENRDYVDHGIDHHGTMMIIQFNVISIFRIYKIEKSTKCCI